ncbi:hypothetical protein NP233_g2900 [Leucocoprinus birnbaumii]|uniref:Uncharacterized protein n=1 Tax=Leucocoprinus birnbaumii TaxID=56174 RepID=A0AAD5VY25_9AGAR|nr:hypothetical protein NP233_g2900 [Leucocoprinus birnbaumii]
MPILLLARLPRPNNHHDHLEEIEETYAQIRQIDISVAALSRQRSSLTQRLDLIHPTARVLPAEILLIFCFACTLPSGASPETTTTCILVKKQLPKEQTLCSIGRLCP